jgi:hypothetical protein
MNIEKIATWAVIILVGAVALVALLSKAETPLGGVVWDDEIFQQDVDIKGNLDLDGNAVIGGSATITGALSASGAVAGLQSLTAVSTAITTTTLTNADSGKTFIISTTTNFVLPATSTSAGVYYRFAVGGLFTTNVTIQTSDLGKHIEGALIVAGAVVDCDAEHTITFVADGENIGDYVELYSNGTYWLIGDSGALTGSKLTCTDA